jgi:hypothetical protein
MMKFLVLIFLLCSLILESSILNLPLILLVLIPLTVIYRNYLIFIVAIIFGILLDILSFKSIGASSIFFCTFIFLILMYDRRFEITTNYFIIFASFFGSLSFIIFYGYHNIILGTMISVAIGVLVYKILRKFSRVE